MHRSIRRGLKRKEPGADEDAADGYQVNFGHLTLISVSGADEDADGYRVKFAHSSDSTLISL